MIRTDQRAACGLVGIILALSAVNARVDAGYVDAVLADDPVAYYRLGEASGSATAANSSTNGATLDGTYVNFPDPATGDAGLGLAGPRPAAFNGFESTNSAAHFDPSAATYVEAADDPLLDITGALTLEAWVKIDATNTGAMGIVSKYLGNGDKRSYLLDITSDGKPEFVVTSGGTFASATTLTSSTVLSTDTWTHLVSVFDPGTAASGDSSMAIYIDGVLDSSLAGGPDAIFSGTAPLWLGTQFSLTSSNARFNGLIDEAAVYNTALSDTRIAAHYAEALYAAVPEPGSGLMLMLGLGGLLTWRRRGGVRGVRCRQA